MTSTSTSANVITDGGVDGDGKPLTHTQVRVRYNQRMERARRRASDTEAAFFAANLKVLLPFLTDKVASRVRKDAERRGEDALSTCRASSAVDADAAPVLEQPECVPKTAGEMRPYQRIGLDFLLKRHDAGTSMILGDEMGLGKTLQTISFLGSLTIDRGLRGKHLVVVPLSVISNWHAEFRKWCPGLRVLKAHTSGKEEKDAIRRKITQDLGSFDVVLTTYEMLKAQKFSKTLQVREDSLQYISISLFLFLSLSLSLSLSPSLCLCPPNFL